MKVLIVGGGDGKASGIITKLHALLEAQPEVESAMVINEYNPKHKISLSGFNLVLWWPDVDNKEPKSYPVKDQGAVLICSKVMRADTTRVDAVTRIFKMHGNAVVTIDSNGGKFEFDLIDALNNSWRRTTSLSKLVTMIMSLYKWTKESVRVSLTQNDWPEGLEGILDVTGISDFIDVNKELALKVATGCSNRFFGNYSTRCTKLFPSTRKGKDYFFFSPRNVDKKYVTTEDLVLTDIKYYYGTRKPSVDTPVQLELYKYFSDIEYMIHGHAYIKGAITTKFYYPCGDLREVDEVVQVVDKTGATRINLLNHGFLLIGKDMAQMKQHLKECEFKMIGG